MYNDYKTTKEYYHDAPHGYDDDDYCPSWIKWMIWGAIAGEAIVLILAIIGLYGILT